MGGESKRVQLTDDQFHAIARALGDARRMSIFEQIAGASSRAPLACAELGAQQQIGAATISHHLKELAEAGLITCARTGRVTHLVPVRAIWKAYLRRLANF